MSRSGEEDETASRSDTFLGDGKSSLHIVDSAESHGMESTIGRHGFDSGRPNFGEETERADRLAEEGRLFVLRFGDCDLNVRAEKSDGEAGKTRSGAEVEQGRGVGVKVTGGEETFSKVAANDLLRFADGGEIGVCVPLQEKVEVDRKLGEERCGGIRKVGNEEISDFGFGEAGSRE